MSTRSLSRESLEHRSLLQTHWQSFTELLERYGAYNPQLFGSVARGTAGPESDLDILVEMDPADGNVLMRAAGLMEETRNLLGTQRVDIFPLQLLKDQVSQQALTEAVPLWQD